MKLDKYFEKAINEGSWKKVCNVYKAITGKDIEPPTTFDIKSINIEDDDDSNNEYNTSDIEMEDDEEEYDEDEDDDGIITSTRKKSDRQRKVSNSLTDGDGKCAKKRQMKLNHQNTFKDDLRLFPKENVKKYKTDENGIPLGTKPRPRNKKRSTLVDVKCSMCGTNEQVSPKLARGYSEIADENVYRCNDCCTGGGRLRVKRNENERAFD
jgi:hypothetical protein